MKEIVFIVKPKGSEKPSEHILSKCAAFVKAHPEHPEFHKLPDEASRIARTLYLSSTNEIKL